MEFCFIFIQMIPKSVCTLKRNEGGALQMLLDCYNEIKAGLNFLSFNESKTNINNDIFAPTVALLFHRLGPYV